MKLRKKDPRRRNRLRSRRTARKMLRRRRLAIVAALALVIGVGLLRVTTGGGWHLVPVLGPWVLVERYPFAAEGGLRL